VQQVVNLAMDMKLGINRGDLSNAFIRREKEISADSKDKEKKKQPKKTFKKKSSKDSYKGVFENFHSIDLLG
tara:strand:- start:391 stop:606 length:216 start_codon:yes stop_codon:yes gene_type:complete